MEPSSGEELERQLLSGGVVSGVAQVGQRPLKERVRRTRQRLVTHTVYAVSSIVGDDILGRSTRSAALRLAGARLGRQSSIHGGTYVSIPANLRLGIHSFVNRNCYFDLSDTVDIGSYVMVGHGVSFVTTIHDIVPGMNLGAGIASAPIVVGDRAWIGANATILPGVTIGRDAIVATGAVVTRDVPPNSLVAGAPARLSRPVARSWIDERGRYSGLTD